MEKFQKPVGRMLPLVRKTLPAHQPFYFYHEVYNLQTKDGLHQTRTTYEIYNKQKMRQEIVDVLIKDNVEEGDIGFYAAKYHPMDLAAGQYLIVVRCKDVLSGRERSAIGEFELVEKSKQ